LFIFLTFVISFAKIASDKDAYVNQFIESGVTAAVSFQGTSAGTAGGGTQTLSLDIGSLLTPDAVRQGVTRDKIAAVITSDRVKNALLDGVPGWNSISNRSAFEEDVRQNLIDDVYANIGTDLPAMLSNVKAQQQVNTGTGTPTPAPSQLSPSIKELLGRMPWFVAFYNNFSLVMAIIVTSVVAFFFFISRIFATLFAWMLNKLY
jgi:hypothetical protein